mmetsp:Transcript_25326/g.50444  ORF Transcript_25326/g.50444 Transcript_25326/m.50444 type:complete len:246 (+) Transcript_25326:65-802(+)
MPMVCLFHGFLLPFVVVPDGMGQQFLQQGGPPERRGQRQMSLGRLFDVVNKFGRAEPFLFAFHVPVGGGPPDLFAEDLEVPLRQPPHIFLDGVSKFPPRKTLPQPFDGRQVRVGDVLHFREIDKVPPLAFGARDDDQGVAGELIGLEQLSGGEHGGERHVVHAAVARQEGRDLVVRHVGIRRRRGRGRPRGAAARRGGLRGTAHHASRRNAVGSDGAAVRGEGGDRRDGQEETRHDRVHRGHLIS